MTTPIYANKEGPLRGYDPVAYFTQNRAMKGSPKYQYKGWHFVNKKHLHVFQHNPTAFEPQYGGYCAYAMRRGHFKSSDPEVWTITDGQLYVNYSKKIRDIWVQVKEQCIIKANSAWAKLWRGLYVDREINFGPSTLDLYRPKSIRGAVVWFHRGGFTFGDKADPMDVVVAHRLAREGYLVVVPNYRLSKYPIYIEDGATSVFWLADHFDGPIFLGGHSAGAYLVSLIALDSKYGLTERLSGVFAICGETITHFKVRDERGIPKTQIIVDDAAPLYHVRPNAPPMLLICGKEEEAITRNNDNRLFVSAMEQVGHQQSRFIEVPGRNHLGTIGYFQNQQDPVARQVIKFLKKGAV